MRSVPASLLLVAEEQFGRPLQPFVSANQAGGNDGPQNEMEDEGANFHAF